MNRGARARTSLVPARTVFGSIALAAIPATSSAIQEDVEGEAPEAAAAGSPETDSAATDPAWGIPVQGSFGLRYRLRRASGEGDQDAYGLLDLDLGDRAQGPWTAHVLARTSLDLDGKTDSTGGYVFDSLEDTYDSRFHAVLLEGYLDCDSGGPIESVRLGRQLAWDAPFATCFDGLRADSEELGALRVTLGAYGGVPSHLYESSADGDLILGAFAQSRPWQGGRLRADWMHVDDQTSFGAHADSLVHAALWQQVGERLSVHGAHTLLDGRGRDLLLRGTWHDAEEDALVQVDWFSLLTTQRARALEFDPFFNATAEYRPYQDLRVLASKGFGEHLDLTAGVDVRRLRHDSDEAAFNREFERWHLGPSLSGWPFEDAAISATVEIWDAGDEEIATAGVDVRVELDERTKLRAGSIYSLWKYDGYTASEREHVRSWFARLDSRWSESLRLRLEYEYERDDFTGYHTLQAGATWTF